MKKIVKAALIFLLPFFIISSSLTQGYANNTSEAVEAIDLTKECSLKLTYQKEANKSGEFNGNQIEIYQFASVSENARYSLINEFSTLPVDVNSFTSQSEWEALSTTISAYITAEKIPYTMKAETDAPGNVIYNDLKPGMYYVQWTGNKTNEEATGFEPFIIAVPNLGEDGRWIYDVKAIPKKEEKKHYKEYSVIKQWKDDGDKELRADLVSIEIDKNGEYYKTVELSQENNWTYKWESEETDEWNIVEREVPDGYYTAVEKQEGTFIVTNTVKEHKNPSVPHTGDNNNNIIYIVLMISSASVLVITFMFGKKRKSEK